MEQLKGEIQNWARKMKGVVVSPKVLDQLERDCRRLSRDIQEIEARLLPLEDMPQIAAQLWRLGREQGLRIESISPVFEAVFPSEGLPKGRQTGAGQGKTSSDGQEIVQVPVLIQLRGRFGNLTRFLEAIPKAPFLFNVQEIAIETDPKTHPTLSIRVVGYLFLRGNRP